MSGPGNFGLARQRVESAHREQRRTASQLAHQRDYRTVAEHHPRHQRPPHRSHRVIVPAPDRLQRRHQLLADSASNTSSKRRSSGSFSTSAEEKHRVRCRHSVPPDREPVRVCDDSIVPYGDAYLHHIRLIYNTLHCRRCIPPVPKGPILPPSPLRLPVPDARRQETVPSMRQLPGRVAHPRRREACRRLREVKFAQKPVEPTPNPRTAPSPWGKKYLDPFPLYLLYQCVTNSAHAS